MNELQDLEGCFTPVGDSRKVGIRISPMGTFGDVNDANPLETFSYLVAQLNSRNLAYLHVNRPDWLGGTFEGYDALLRALRDLYTGIVLAHPINASLVGKDLTDVPDASGKHYRREIIDLAQRSGKGWVEYQYKNPTSGKIEPKTTYILRVGDVVLEAGIYKK